MKLQSGITMEQKRKEHFLKDEIIVMVEEIETRQHVFCNVQIGGSQRFDDRVPI